MMGSMQRWMMMGVVISSAACSQGVQFTDSLDFRFDLRRVAGEDQLSQPYVEGTEVRIRITSPRNLGDVDVVSSDPSVFACDTARLDDEAIRMDCTAVSAGVADLVVTKPNGNEIGRGQMEVGRPDRVELHSAGAVFAMLGDEKSETADPLLLEGGRATFEVRWFEGDERLFGNNVLDAVADGGLDAVTDNSFLGENREWLRLDGATLGAGAVHLETLGRRIDTHAVEVVPASRVVDLTLRGDSEIDAIAGDSIAILGEATDADFNVVYGAEYTWFHGQMQEFGSGDMYRYTFEEGVPGSALEAEFDGLLADVVIHGTGEVASSNNRACNTASGGAPVGLLALVGLFGMRRRR